jgi:hypothetical protein
MRAGDAGIVDQHIDCDAFQLRYEEKNGRFDWLTGTAGC